MTLNAILTAAITGGLAALVQVNMDPNGFNWKVTGSAFAAGAVAGVVNLLRSNKPSIEK